MQNLINFLHAAQSKLTYPKMRAKTQSGQTIMFTIAGQRARFPGSINITNGKDYNHSQFYGRILKTGVIQTYNTAPNDLKLSLGIINKDPVKAARIFGDITSNCCFCNKLLSNPDSVAMGYGATCAANFEMPYITGHKKKEYEVDINNGIDMRLEDGSIVEFKTAKDLDLSTPEQTEMQFKGKN